jgi:hypothetical protein
MSPGSSSDDGLLMESPVAITKLLADYGPWGMLALSLFALRWLFLKYDAAQEARIKEGKENGVLVAAANDALTKTHSLIEAQNARMAALIPFYRPELNREGKL